MSEKRFTLSNPISHNPIPSWVSIIHDDIEHKHLNAEEICDLLNEQKSIIDKQELRLQHLEELLELSENLNKSYKEKLIDMNLKMMGIDDEC